MECSVCGSDERCYVLSDVDQGAGSRMYSGGMIFLICTKCLSKLIEPIRTEKTALDDPESPPNPGAVRRKLAGKGQPVNVKGAVGSPTGEKTFTINQ